MKAIYRATMVFVFSTIGSQAFPCSQHGTNAGNGLWLPTSEVGGLVQGVILLQSTLVPPTSPTTCVAGIGLGSTGNLAPSGLDVTGLEFVVVNSADGSRAALSAFSFSVNPATTNGLTAGSGSSTVPGTNPLFAGSTWFGFSADVSPFSAPILAAGEFLALQFSLEVDDTLLPLTLDAQFGAGPGQSNGTPIFDGAHPVQYYAATDPQLELIAPIPEPTALALAAIGVLSITCRTSRAT